MHGVKLVQLLGATSVHIEARPFRLSHLAAATAIEALPDRVRVGMQFQD
jgi:hypothetical protein